MAKIKIAFPVLLLLVGICFSCQDKQKVIPEDELVAVLTDIHMLDGVVRQAKYRDWPQVPDTLDVYEYVLNKHGYSRAQFDSSISYYSHDPARFENIYQEVLSRLNRKETRIREQQNARKEAQKAAKGAEKKERQTDSNKNTPPKPDNPDKLRREKSKQ